MRDVHDLVAPRPIANEELWLLSAPARQEIERARALVALARATRPLLDNPEWLTQLSPQQNQE